MEWQTRRLSEHLENEIIQLLNKIVREFYISKPGTLLMADCTADGYAGSVF